MDLKDKNNDKCSSSEHKVAISKPKSSLIEQEFNSVRENFQNEIVKMEEEMSKFRKQLISPELNNSNNNNNNYNYNDFIQSTTATPTKHFNDDDYYDDVISNDKAFSLSSRPSSSLDSSSLVNSTSTTTTKSSSKRSTRTSTISMGMEEGQQLIQEHQQKQQQLQHLFADIPRRKSQEKTFRSSSPFYQKQQQQQWWLDLNSPLIHHNPNGTKTLLLRFDVASYEPEQILVRTIDNRLQVEAKREEKSENASVYKEYNREFLLPPGINIDSIRSSLSADGVLTIEAPLPSMEALDI